MGMTIAVIKTLSPMSFHTTAMTKEQFVEIATVCEAYWIHNGDPKQPHAQLTSGLCSNGYLNLMKILQYSNLSQIFAHLLLQKLPESILNKVDWILGSAYTATGLAKDAANILGAKWAPLRKDAYHTQHFTHGAPADNETILHVEDIITTGKSLLSAHHAIRAAAKNAHIIPSVPVIAHRPSTEIIPLHQFLDCDIDFCPYFEFGEFWVLPQQKCTLCRAGSRPLQPKLNWQLLTSI